MTSEKKVWPLGTNHTDSEGTPWKRDEQNNWWFWQENFGWSRYVGPGGSASSVATVTPLNNPCKGL
ncbi:hypothetical protein RG139_002297 [Acinetobacter baumannii]|nr:hypothetical protein [Acinetobacter baumannii]